MRMPTIEAVLVEPVGCLAEFGSHHFEEIAVRIFSQPVVPARSGSSEYWRALKLMADDWEGRTRSARIVIERIELQAADEARLYEDVVPALAELKSLGTRVILTSSLCSPAVMHFLEKHSLHRFFSDIWSRDTAGGVGDVPLTRALQCRFHQGTPEDLLLQPTHVIFITDTAAGLRAAMQAGVHAILMMNEPDEAMKLTTLRPAGGIVSMHELPDLVRFVAAANAGAAVAARDGARA